MEDILLDIKRRKRGYCFYDKNDPFFPTQSFNNKDDGVTILETYFYEEEIISASEALSLLERIIRLRYLPITVKAKHQLEKEFEVLGCIYDWYEELKFLSFMLEGETGLPKLKILQNKQSEGYILTQHLLSDCFYDKVSGLSILKDLLEDEEITLVEFLRIENDITSSSLPEKIKPAKMEEKKMIYEKVTALPINPN